MKKIFLFIALLFTYLIIFNTNTVYAQELEINSKYAILYNLYDNLLLYEKNSNTQVPMASLTKIMTTLVAIENIKDFNQTVTLGANVFQGLAEANASVAGFKYNEKVTYYDLLMGAMLPSGADATRGLAINISGSEAQYVELMNKKAQELNLKNTHFANTHGLDADGHYTTAYDLAIITSYALENPIFQEIVSTKNTKVVNKKDDTNRYLKNKNKLLFTLENCVGVKTGYTDDAGRCLVSAVDKDGMKLVCVVLNCGPMFEESAALLKECLNKYKMCNITELYEYDRTVTVEKGAKKFAKIGTKNEFFYPLNEKEIKNLKFVYDYQKTVYAPLKSGSEIGQIQTFLGNNLLFSEKIYTIEDIKPKSVLQRMKDFFGEW